jgi:hypothetical protein
MDFRQRQACISGKLENYTKEISALKSSGIGYQLGFGILLLVLFPVFLLEILLVILFGKDIRVFVPTTRYEPPKLIEEEVPESLRDLIPLARKFGVGDDADRDYIMKAASPSELADLEKMVFAPRHHPLDELIQRLPKNKKIISLTIVRWYAPLRSAPHIWTLDDKSQERMLCMIRK